MLAFLCHLIHHSWFDHINVCFLPVGHTHTEEVDGMFGNIGSRKKFDPIWSIV